MELKMDDHLKEAQKYLLDSRDPASWLTKADNYMELYNKDPKAFILPTAHNMLQPIIDAYADDLPGFLVFVRTIRDEVNEDRYKDMHTFYRKMLLREAQVSRRRRMYQAVAIIENDLYKRFTTETKVKVGAWVEAYWGKERMDTLSEARRNTSGNKISTDVRTEICDDFWASIDDQLSHGIAPTPPEIVYESS